MGVFGPLRWVIIAGPTVQQTAEHMLPVAFRLLEAAVEVLASDAEDGTPSSLDPRHGLLFSAVHISLLDAHAISSVQQAPGRVRTVPHLSVN
jgi:hypothetical protein